MPTTLIAFIVVISVGAYLAAGVYSARKFFEHLDGIFKCERSETEYALGGTLVFCWPALALLWTLQSIGKLATRSET